MDSIITELTGMLNIPILILGLLVGYVLKHLVSDEAFQNKYIPVVNIVLGAIVGVILCVTGGSVITAEAILLAIISGAVSAAASSGVYDAFKAFIEHGSFEIGAEEDTATDTKTKEESDVQLG